MIWIMSQSWERASSPTPSAALYIDCFGFTPKRLQSTWLVCVLLFGSACALYTHLTGRKSMRIWMIFGAVTLALLCIW